MESSSEEDEFSFHEGIIPQSNISSLHQSHTEKGVRKLCCELLDLKDSAQNLCANTRAKYLAFLRLPEEVVEMDHELVELRKHISTLGNLIQELGNGTLHELEECIKADDLEDQSESQLLDLEDLSCKGTQDSKRVFLEKVDVLVTECKLQEAMEALDMEERSSSELRSGPDASLDASSYRSTFLKRKASLESQLIKIAELPSVGDAELKQALCSLFKLGKGTLAHLILLKRYGSRLRRKVETFIPSCSLFPHTYSVTLSKIVFSFISVVAKESLSTFGDDPIYGNKVVQFAEEEIESFVRVVKENGQSSDMASALLAASICVEASLRNCAVLEEQGLKLSKLLMILLRPYMEEVLEMNYRRCRRELADIAENDDIPMSPRFVSPLSVFAPSSGSSLINSGLKFIFIVKDIVEQLTPMATIHFGVNVLSRIAQLFDSYVDLLTKALPSPSEDDGMTELKEGLPFKAESDSQQLAILGVAYTVVDELLPMAVSRIWNLRKENLDLGTGLPESIMPVGGNAVEFKEWRRQLQPSLDKLRDCFCRQYVLNFIYSREGKARLDARIYVDGEGEDLHWYSDPLPSLPFQALFARLQQLATVAGDMLLGKEKLQKVLLARLTETVVIWLSDEHDFWCVFEDETVPLKPFGLQQLILDMHFTVEIARFAGYPSRQVLQIASGIIARAVRTFSARGIDPQSTLPEDEWFSESAKASINKLMLGVSGSEVSEAEDEHVVLHHEHIVFDSDDSISTTSTVDSFHSFVSAEMGDTDSSSPLTDHDG